MRHKPYSTSRLTGTTQSGRKTLYVFLASRYDGMQSLTIARGSLSFLFFNRFFFLLKSSFKFIAKFIRRYRGFPCTPCPYTSTAFPTINILPRSGTFATIYEPISTHRCHSKSVVYIRAHSWCALSGFWQMYWMATCIHHFRIRQNSFTGVKNLCVLPIRPSLSPESIAWKD